MLQVLKKYKYDILICITLLVISIIEIIHIDITFYNSGLRNTPSFEFILFVFIYESLKVIIVLFAIGRIFFGLNYNQKIRRYIITAILTILIFIGSWILPFEIDKTGSKYFLLGYEKWVNKNVEIDKIQEWLLSGNVEKFLGRFDSDGALPDNMPVFLKNVKSHYFYIHENSIEFVWLGFDYTYGIVVCLPTIKTIQEGKIINLDNETELRRSIKPGVYIFEGE